MDERIQKVCPRHLSRNAYLYVRQSTVRQVFENAESGKRQYALRDKAVGLGWQMDKVIVIDGDQGHSAASMTDREGFKRLVTEVGLGHAGIVMGLEVSRLARNNADWHRLLEMCALADTLIMDDDGIYAPNDFNDRLLLGLKGTMSEAELHVLKTRLRGGIVNKAKRGALNIPIPVGYVRNAENRTVLVPDKQVQDTIRFFFETFQRTGSASGVVRLFRKQGVKFPKQWWSGHRKDTVAWAELTLARARRTLHNPCYAGAFCYGKTKMTRTDDGKHQSRPRPREEWLAMINDAHPGYITWGQYENNLRTLEENSRALNPKYRTPPREGCALLQGLVVCGICGSRMTVAYHLKKGQFVPQYICSNYGVEHAQTKCQAISGQGIDNAISNLLREAFSSHSMQITLAVREKLQSRLKEVDNLRKQEAERARYEVEQARLRYMMVDPGNRLVADVLEGEWNNKLRAYHEIKNNYDKQNEADLRLADEIEREKLLGIARDFPKIWNNPGIPSKDRKRIIRLIIEDVTLVKGQEITISVRFKGGATRILNIPKPLPAGLAHKTSNEVISKIDSLLDCHIESEIADVLNQQGYRSGTCQKFSANIVRDLRAIYGLKKRYDRLREKGMLTIWEVMGKLDISYKKAREFQKSGVLSKHKCSNRGEYLFEIATGGCDVI
jgi:DNA invertase Pin-like site-specific DNA recombinase